MGRESEPILKFQQRWKRSYNN
ncbi:uncharacterized protein G2W53_011531 [Senna tora]|uniref:Uncharacterized protein n=1 Tax=Senna tora TaxID=362788 RepID=A0A835CFA9_9FABA|nr:uncharacterized protein G2W53_011531 [Senna tora]